MHAEVIAIGTELTTGAKLDTNSQWLSLALAELGIPTHFHSTVADDLEAMTDVMRAASNRSDLVFITGGLGPTLDDLTRHAMAQLMQVELVLDQPSLDFIESLFQRRNRHMPKRNRIQAMFPAGSEVIANPRGTAPGIWMEVPRKGYETPSLFAAMPGVPSEMRRMFEQEIRPRLPGSNRVIRRARVNCYGLGESTAEEMLGELTARGRDPDIGITVHEATITLRITAYGESGEECDGKIVAAKAEITARMGKYIFGEEDDELEHAVAAMLIERGASLATAESGTGGLLAYRIAETHQLKAHFRGGLVAADDTGLNGQLSLPSDASRKELAEATANAVRKKFDSDYALAVLECPDFDPDSRNDDAPATFVALADTERSIAFEVSLFGDPAIQKSRLVKSALNLLRLRMLETA